jgi:hypothetical protein
MKFTELNTTSRRMYFLPVIAMMIFISSTKLVAEDNFQVFPYLQNPDSDAVTIIWFSHGNTPGNFIYGRQGSTDEVKLTSSPTFADALAYSSWENNNFFNGNAPAAPYRHRLRLTGLTPATIYNYSVKQGSNYFNATFKTAPGKNNPIRFIVYSDCETEPESTGNFVDWIDPVTGNHRDYLIDQITGYANNLEVIQTREPNFFMIAGDLVASGGEQRNWDEFWRHLTQLAKMPGLASYIPVFAALGNHDYNDEGTSSGYTQPGSEKSIKRFLTYFEFPPNNSPNKQQEGRYYRLDYGPVTIITLDVCNNSPNKSDNDTNFSLSGENDPNGGNAPDFNPNSRQYRWLENQLAEAQLKSTFTFLVFHYAPYSVGPHGRLPGETDNHDDLSGMPVRVLTSLLMRYGVDAVFSGHDEMWERSEVTGNEVRPDGREHAHTIQFYDVGVSGDGLREPVAGLVNPYQKFLVYKNVPEIWKNGVLIDGGRHYGHLEVDVYPRGNGEWEAKLTPVYVFPIFGNGGQTYLGYERRVYNDQILLVSSLLEPSSPVELVSFSARTTEKGISLSWQTQTETQNYGFEIERQVGSSWNKIAFIKGNGTTAAPHYYDFLDQEAYNDNRIVRYRLKQIDINDNFHYSKVIAMTSNFPQICANYPNPFNLATRIEYVLPEECEVSVIILNLQGQKIRTLTDKKTEAGLNVAIWDGTDDQGNIVAAGLYFYRIESKLVTVTKKMMLIK